MKLKNIILITLIIILVIALIIMTKLYFNMRASAQDSLTSTLELAEEMFDANVKIEKLEEDIENLKNGKEIQTHNFLAEIKEIKEEKGKTFFVVDGLDSNSENDYKGELTITIDEETKFFTEKIAKVLRTEFGFRRMKKYHGCIKVPYKQMEQIYLIMKLKQLI